MITVIKSQVELTVSTLYTSTEVVNKEHEKFCVSSKLEYFAPINLIVTTVLRIISGSPY